MALLAWSATAVADEDDPLSRSNALFEEAKHLQAAGAIHDACAKYEESYRLAARGGTLLNLGLCHELEGKLLAARRELRDALAMAKRDGRADREPVAVEHLAAVEAKLAWVIVVPPPNVREEALEVRVDGAPIDRKDWVSVAVEPGRHVVGASASGFRPREVTVSVSAPGAKQLVRLEALDAIAAVAPPPAERPAAPSSALRTAAFVAGVAGVALSLGAGAWALERKGVVSNHCNASKVCDPTGADAASTGGALVVASTVAFAIGAVGFGAWIVLPSGDTRASTPHAQVLGLRASGEF